VFYCFGCGVGGDVIEFVKLFENTDFKGACKSLGIGDKPQTKREKRQAAREIARQKRAVRELLEEKEHLVNIDRWRWVRAAWLDSKICQVKEIMALAKNMDHLDGMEMFYHIMPIWEYELDCLIFNSDVEGFYNARP